MIRKEFLRFAIIGFFSIIVNYSMFYIPKNFLDIDYTLASTLGFMPEIANVLTIGLLATCTNFIGTKFFVIRT